MKAERDKAGLNEITESKVEGGQELLQSICVSTGTSSPLSAHRIYIALSYVFNHFSCVQWCSYNK